jgi:hypothetical protein
MYTSKHGSALEVAQTLGRDHQALLGAILNWQEVVFRDEALPTWLKPRKLLIYFADDRWHMRCSVLCDAQICPRPRTARGQNRGHGFAMEGHPAGG